MLPTKMMKTLEISNHRSLTLAARNEAPRNRAATVRESVLFLQSWTNVFNGVTMGLEPAKGDEDVS